MFYDITYYWPSNAVYTGRNASKVIFKMGNYIIWKVNVILYSTIRLICTDADLIIRNTVDLSVHQASIEVIW